MYARKNFKESLRIFQDVLRYNPSCIPDPRIGIGLCYWAMDQKSKAKAAWQRSLEVVSHVLHVDGNLIIILPESFRMVRTIASRFRVNQRQQKQSTQRRRKGKYVLSRNEND